MGSPLDAPAIRDLRHLDPQTAERVRTAVRRLADAGQGDVARLQASPHPSGGYASATGVCASRTPSRRRRSPFCACCHGGAPTVSELYRDELVVALRAAVDALTKAESTSGLWADDVSASVDQQLGVGPSDPSVLMTRSTRPTSGSCRRLETRASSSK